MAQTCCGCYRPHRSSPVSQSLSRVDKPKNTTKKNNGILGRNAQPLRITKRGEMQKTNAAPPAEGGPKKPPASREEMIDFLRSGCKPKENWRYVWWRWDHVSFVRLSSCLDNNTHKDWKIGGPTTKSRARIFRYSENWRQWSSLSRLIIIIFLFYVFFSLWLTTIIFDNVY